MPDPVLVRVVDAGRAWTREVWRVLAPETLICPAWASSSRSGLSRQSRGSYRDVHGGFGQHPGLDLEMVFHFWKRFSFCFVFFSCFQFVFFECSSERVRHKKCFSVARDPWHGLLSVTHVGNTHHKVTFLISSYDITSYDSYETESDLLLMQME